MNKQELINQLKQTKEFNSLNDFQQANITRYEIAFNNTSDIRIDLSYYDNEKDKQDKLTNTLTI